MVNIRRNSRLEKRKKKEKKKKKKNKIKKNKNTIIVLFRFILVAFCLFSQSLYINY